MEENRKGPGVFYAVVGVATLVVAIIGATFAYFSASAQAETPVTGGTLDLSSNFKVAVTQLQPDQRRASSEKLVPAKFGTSNDALTATNAVSAVTSALKSKCEEADENGYRQYGKEEEQYDGFYAVVTNLDDDPCEIIKVNKQRWRIEECFRIMKTEFKSRPVYVQKDNRIEAHFITCYIALVLYRYLEKRLNGKYTCEEIIDALQSMNVTEVVGEGYIPAYTRTELTDDLHEIFGFRTDYRFLTKPEIKKILKLSKAKRRYAKN